MSYLGKSRGLAAIAAVLSLVAALGVVTLMKFLDLPDDAVIVAVILLLPLFVYLVLSGSLEELRVGDWLIKLKRTTSESVNTAEVIPVKPIMIVQEEFKEIPEEEFFQNPNALLLKVVQEEEPVLFDLCGYLKYLNERLGLDTVKYFIAVDGSEQFLWLVPLSSIITDPDLKTPEGKCNAHQLMKWIYFGQFEKIARMNHFVARETAASPDWSKQRCLREMHKRKLEALPVVKDGELKGILERTRLVTSILVDVSGSL